MMTHHIGQIADKSKRLFTLTDAKQFALYALSDFNEGGYFKVKHAFFRFALFSQWPLVEFLFLEG
ncbi:hypothetical protein [Photorhabdus akhurstii]|uniref:hypothetical protein n=1 Tax=Photorhabdus akhurstii TaxID=171438 RepID=UPI00052D1A8F|nr:hypothetical protein [Photorhabdus akhurstii]KGM29756.1 hypothetical protein KS18_02490 [Photorhabdus luminescens]MBS9427238.1 hypothetical protein [Photorhabdus akhurstii]